MLQRENFRRPLLLGCCGNHLNLLGKAKEIRGTGTSCGVIELPYARMKALIWQKVVWWVVTMQNFQVLVQLGKSEDYEEHALASSRSMQCTISNRSPTFGKFCWELLVMCCSNVWDLDAKWSTYLWGQVARLTKELNEEIRENVVLSGFRILKFLNVAKICWRTELFSVMYRLRS